MPDIYINDVLVGSLSEMELDKLKTQAMENRISKQLKNIISCLSNMSWTALKLAPFIIMIMLIAVVNHYVIGLHQKISFEEFFQLFVDMLIPSFMLGFTVVIFSMALFSCRFGYRNVAREEFYRLLRVKLGVAATGVIKQINPLVNVRSTAQ